MTPRVWRVCCDAIELLPFRSLRITLMVSAADIRVTFYRINRPDELFVWVPQPQ